MPLDDLGAYTPPDLPLCQWIDLQGRWVWIHEFLGLFARVTWTHDPDYEDGDPDGSDSEWIHFDALCSMIPIVDFRPNLFSGEGEES